MSTRNPTGYPLSSEPYETEDGDFVVAYRPRIAGRRRRVQVPAAVADEYEQRQAVEVAARHQLADEQPRRRKKRPKKAAKKKAAKKAPAKKAPAKKAAKKAKKTPARKPPPRVVQQLEQPHRPTHRSRDKEIEPRRPKPDDPQMGLAFNPRSGGSIAHVGVSADLARVESIIIERPDGTHEMHKWRRNRPRMLWSPKTRTLFWANGSQRLYDVEDEPTRRDSAAHLYERFTARPAARTAKLRIPATPPELYGRPVTLIYRSDKWGPRGQRIVRYEHDFSPGVRVYVAPGRGGRGPVFVLRGGRLTVTDRGIVF